MSSDEEKIGQLCSLTGATAEMSGKCLEIAGGNVELAADLLLSQMSSQGGNSSSTTPSGSGSNNNNASNNTNNNNSMRKPSNSTSNRSSSSSRSSKNNKTGGRRGVATLSSLKRGSDSDDDSESDEDGNDLYTGGQSSGMMVQAPGKGTKRGVEKLFENAKKLGATEESHFADESNHFMGGGYNLGTENEQSQKISNVKRPRVVKKVITFWRTGFTVDEGTLRGYKSPENKEFLMDLDRGLVPRELEAQLFPGQKVEVALSDRKNEDPPFRQFGGSGMSLGAETASANSTATSNSSSSTATTQVNTASTSSSSQSSSKSFKVDTSQPTTSIQLRLHDGTRIPGSFNHTHTVQDLYNFVQNAVPGNKPFDLMTIRPTVILNNMDQTLKEANLLDSVVVQKLK